jgi:hypothetical protein
MKDRATEMLEGIEEECRKVAKSEEEYRKCVQEKLGKLLQSEEAKAIASETLKNPEAE